MIYELHEDDRGSFQELAHSEDVKFGQLSLLKVNPSCVRGGHYHTRKQEWFCCIRGICATEMTDIRDNTKRTVIMEENEQEFICVKPYESHIVHNLSESTVCELLVIISEPYNPDDADTFTK